MTAGELLDLDADIMATCPHDRWDGWGYCRDCGADTSLLGSLPQTTRTEESR